MTTAIAALILGLAAPAAWAESWNGTVSAGGVFVDEEGDRSTVQETYNLHEGFVIGRIHLDGNWDERNWLLLDLRDINLDSRRGHLRYRRPGVFTFTATQDQHRQVFDAGRGVTAERRDWQLGARLTPARGLAFGAEVNHLAREGDRLPFPAGPIGVLGTRYDNTLVTGQLSADWHRPRLGAGVTWRMSEYSDVFAPLADRTGQVVSGRLHAQTPFYDRWTHLIGAVYGRRELSDGDLEYTLAAVRYTAVVQPLDPVQLRYAFDATRTDYQATDLMTDRFIHDVDLTWFHRYGRLGGGYAYETNDDDRTLTAYQSWHAGAAFRPGRWLHARVDYAGRVKDDQEDLTLLKDIEASRVRARLEVQPVTGLTLGGDYTDRRRELPDIDVSVDGTSVGALARWLRPGWGSLSADYTHAVDEYQNLVAGFETESDIVTGRLEVDRIPRLRLAGGVTYLDFDRDLDIEKSMVFAEAFVRLGANYHAEFKYNVFNYDDYVLLDRYYTANVVRFQLGYDLHR